MINRRNGVLALVLVLLAAGLVAFVRRDQAGLTLTADVSRSTAVYVGNAVTVLGVTEGTVTRLVPDGDVVHVHLKMQPGVKVPVGARAAILAPSLVSSRIIALTPAYVSGPAMVNGAVIDQQHTYVPLEIDEILASLRQLASGLGPNGTNKQGALSQFIAAADAALKGNGALAHSTTVSVAKALGTVDTHAQDLADVVTNLSSLTAELAQHDSTVRTFEGDLATASGQLAGDRTQLAAALHDLSTALGQLTDLVKDHRADLQGDLHSLATVTSTLLAHQKELASAIDQLPTFGQNLYQSVDPASGRVDLRFVNESGTAQALPAIGAICKLLDVCDLLNPKLPLAKP